jgi:uncharacterized protein (TIGR03435 family)
MTRDYSMRVALAGLMLTAASLRAQTLDQKPLAFDVASIKPNTDAGAMPTWALQPSGGVAITAYRLRQLIAIAYDSPSIQTRDQVVGGPAWINSDHFDIVAKAEVELENDETGRPRRLLAMLRSLLEDRFKLRMHSEHRTAPVFELTLASKDGRLGPRLRSSAQQDCRGPNEHELPTSATRWCGWRGFGTGHFTIQGLTMEDMARGFASTWSAGRPVFDRTGYQGGGTRSSISSRRLSLARIPRLRPCRIPQATVVPTCCQRYAISSG